MVNPRRFVVAAVSFVLVVAGIAVPQPALAKAKPTSPEVSADKSVVSVPRRAVPQSGAPRRGTGRPQVKPAPVTWPRAGSARVTVPKAGGAAARVGPTAVSVTRPQTTARRAAATPPQVDVTAYDQQTARRLGGHGTALRVTRTDGKADAAQVGIRVDVSGFATAFGGAFESRLRLVAKPACALDANAPPSCGAAKPVPSHVDLNTHTLVADVPVDTGTVYVIAAAASGEEGSYTATKLASSSKWSVGLQAGDFSWKYPVPRVPAISGSAPELSLDYSSQAVDGLTASENAQPSWVGLGWDLATPFIERRYNGCADDGGDTGDLCWAGDELMLSLEGTSSELVRDKAAGGDVWRAKQDPGWRVERFKGAANDDNDGEYWQVTTPQGTKYTFGRGEQPTTGAKTESVFTVPVFGDDSGEPCHKDSIEDSWCTQAWRWNLDGVVDAHGDSTTYFYTRETNRYARNGNADRSTGYIRGGHVRDIVYSQRAGAEDATAPARLHFTTGLRCVEAAGGSGNCPAFDADHASSYPDVPLDQLCTGRCTGDEQKSPTFFTGDLLRSVTAQRSEGTGFVDVDRVEFTYSFPKPSDNTGASLWLEKFQQSGLGGSGRATLPPVEFAGTEFANRVDADPSAGVPALRKLRVTSATDELGRQVDVTYAQPNPCSTGNLPEGRADTNTLNCFPAWRTNGTSAGFGWWHKYLVTKVTVVDRTGGSPPQATEYRYRGEPAWHYDDDDVTPASRKTWSDWRGYGSVDVAQLSDPGYRGEKSSRALTLTRNLYFRGMDGDRLAGGSTKSVSVVDSQGISLADSPWLRGKPRETQQFALDAAGNPTYELGGGLHGYTSAHTTPFETGKTNPDDDAHLVVENVQTNRETVIADPGGQRSSRWTRLETTYDTYGQATAVFDTSSDGNDSKCTTTSYARDAATVDGWMLAFPYRMRTYTGTCAAPATLVSGKDLYYDGSTTLGGTVRKGDAIRTVNAVSASGPDTVTETVTTSATFDAYGRTVTETDGNGHTSRTAYSPDTGRPATVTETNALGQAEVTTLEPDRQQPISVRDRNGQVTTSGYDPLGRLASVRMPEQAAGDPPAKTFEYRLDPGHAKPPLVTTRQLQSGSTYIISWSFLDALGRDRQQQEISPASTADAARTVVTDIRYDDTGHLAVQSLPVVVSGAAGTDLLAVPGDSVDESRYSYDELGRQTRDAQFARGRQLWESATAYFGDHVRQTPPAGGVGTASYSDARGRLVRKVEGTGAGAVTTAYTYTAADQLATATDPAQHKSTYTYDLLKRAISGTDPDSGATRTKYDGNGNAVATWDAKTLAGGGATPTTSTDYDALNRPIARWAGPPGTGTKLASWTYDSTAISNGVGRMAAQTTIKDGKEYTQATLGYDQRGRVTGRSWSFPAGLGGALFGASYSVRYGYDAADHTVSVTYPEGMLGAPKETVTTGYDALGNPATLTGTVTDPITGDSTVTYISATRYAADGKLAGRDYANPLFPLRRAYAYETDTQRLSHVQTLMGNPLNDEMHAKQDDTYRWDPAGNITSITDTTLPEPVATCHGYDGLRRLTHAWTTEKTDCSDAASTLTHDGPAGFNQSWTYSPDGNITSSRSLAVTKNYTYADSAHPHAVTKAGGDSFSYDANGAMRTRPGLLPLVPANLNWDSQQQLESVQTDLVAKTSFVYAPDGTRMVRVDPTGTATLYIDGEEITVALGVLPTGTRFYTEAGVTVAERLPTGLLAWQLNDAQGSAQIAVVSGTGVADRTYYTPYGQIRDLLLQPLTDHGWLGKVKDKTTGLNALGARYYDAELGRFISTDPANDQSSAQAANAYAYGADNPVTFMDPTGLWSLSGAWNSVKKAASAVGDWASEHKGLITDIAVGIGVGIAVGAVCATGVGCVIAAGVIAGAAGAAAGYGVDVAEGKTNFSWGGLATSVGIGAASGLLGAGIGKAVGAGARALLRTEAGQAVKAAVTTGGKAIANTARAAGSKVSTVAKSAGSKITSTVRSAAGKCHSFNPATPVLMADGSVKAIGAIAVGDLVLTTDPVTGKTTQEKVVRLHRNHDTDLADVTVRTASGRTVLHTTQHHPFWSETDQWWTDAAQLQPGDKLHTGGPADVTVESVRAFTGAETMNDLTVDTVHTYYVVADGTPVLVHNCGTVKEYDVVPYRPGNSPLENHHGIMDAWAKSNVPNYVSRAPGSPTIALSKANHDATKAVFRDWLEENYGRRVGAKVDWTNIGPREIYDLSERMFDAANVPQAARDAYYSTFNSYVYGLG